MFQVLANVALLSALIIAGFYFGLRGFLKLDSYLQNKRSIKHAAKYDALLARS